jgi:Putative Actinobacterial Holin-X, holin superfamily III
VVRSRAAFCLETLRSTTTPRRWPRTAGWSGGRSSASQHRDSVITGAARRVGEGLMSVPGVEQVAAVVAREQVEVARRELTARARQAGPGVAMAGGGGLLIALASGAGTAALILLLGRRRGAAAALGVTGAYAGAGAFLAREGLVRLREAAPSLPDVPVQDEPVQDAKTELESAAKRRTKSAAKSTRRAKSAAKSPPQPTGRPKPKSKSPGV